jgi:hypothetical protein
VPQESGTAALIFAGVENTVLRSAPGSGLPARLVLDYVPKLCSPIEIVRSTNISMQDIDIDASRPAQTLVQFESWSDDQAALTLRVPELASGSASFEGMDSNRSWLKLVHTLKPVEFHNDRWRYIPISSLYFEWKKNPKSIASWDEDQRRLTVFGADLGAFKNSKQGDYFMLRHLEYGFDGIRFYRTHGMTFSQVTLRTTAGMGFKGYGSSDITFQNSGIRRFADRAHTVSADAVMLMSCTGRITINNSFFEGHGDDSLNIRHRFDPIVELHVGGDRRSMSFSSWSTAMPFAVGEAIILQKNSSWRPLFRSEVVEVTCRSELSPGCEAEDWFRCCAAGWGEVVVRVKDEVPDELAPGDVASLPNMIPDELHVTGTTFRDCRCKGMVISAGGSSVVLRNNSVEATTGPAVYFAGGPTNRLAYAQVPLISKAIVEGNTLSAQADPSSANTGGYKPGWVTVSGEVNQNWGVIQTTTAILDHGKEVFDPNGLVFGRLTFSNNKITLGGRVMTCPKTSYCPTVYDVFPRAAIHVGGVEYARFAGNIVTDLRTTQGGSPVQPFGCSACANIAPDWMGQKYNQSCDSADTYWGANYLSTLCKTNDNWKVAKYCQQSCADVGASYEGDRCCARVPDHLTVYAAGDFSLNDNKCDGQPCKMGSDPYAR